MKKRDILVVVLLGLFTCGIYSLYWFYTTTEDLNAEDDQEPLMNYFLAILLGIITCGIYLIYWDYKFYQKIDKVTGDNNAIVNFLLGLFLTPIVGMAIAQNSINNHVKDED